MPVTSKVIDLTKIEDSFELPTEPASKYRAMETLEIVQGYLAECEADPHVLPTIEGLALKLNVTVETVNSWSKKFMVFRKLRDRVVLMQKNRLMNAVAFGGKFANAGGGIFLLKANHGMIETNRNLIGNADGSNLETMKIYKPQKLREGEEDETYHPNER